jgi:hypothetical protein
MLTIKYKILGNKIIVYGIEIEIGKIERITKK